MIQETQQKISELLMEAEKEQSSSDKQAESTDTQLGKIYKIMFFREIYFTDNIQLITNVGHFSRCMITYTHNTF